MPAKTLLITGASRGIGAAAARAAVAQGANVALMARSATELQKMEAELGAKALATPGDVRNLEDCQAAVARATAHFGGLDALVNNAGVLEPLAPIAESLALDWETNLQINLLGPVLLTQLTLPWLRQARGVVLNISSGAAVKAIPGWAAYCTSKAGLNHFTRCLAEEEAEITALAFRPGVVDTGMQVEVRQKGDQAMQAEQHARYLEYKKSGKLLDPAYVGRIVAALALKAPKAWSGEFIDIRDERVQALLESEE